MTVGLAVTFQVHGSTPRAEAWLHRSTLLATPPRWAPGCSGGSTTPSSHPSTRSTRGDHAATGRVKLQPSAGPHSLISWREVMGVGRGEVHTAPARNSRQVGLQLSLTHATNTQRLGAGPTLSPAHSIAGHQQRSEPE